MHVRSVNHHEVRAPIEDVARRAVEMIRSADPDRGVPRSDWSVGQVAAHLVVVFGVYTEAVSGGGGNRWVAPYLSGPDRMRDRLAEGNARALAGVPHHDAAALADQLARGVAGFIDALGRTSRHLSVPTPWYGEGQSRTVATLACLGLGELLVHGYDMARALRRPWPVDPADARLVLAAVPSMIPHLVNAETARGVRATYLVHVRGGERFAVRIDGGAATAGAPPGRVDCHLSVDPAAFLLVGYGRVSQWGPIAQGRMVAWGRKPWLGLRFKSLFVNP